MENYTPIKWIGKVFIGRDNFANDYEKYFATDNYNVGNGQSIEDACNNLRIKNEQDKIRC